MPSTPDAARHSPLILRLPILPPPPAGNHRNRAPRPGRRCPGADRRRQARLLPDPGRPARRGRQHGVALDAGRRHGLAV